MDKDYSYSFQNLKRDLNDELSTVLKQDGTNILTLFPQKPEATQRKHEWLEDQITGKRCAVTGEVSSLACPMSAADLAKLRVGTIVNIDGDNAVFRIASKTANAATVELVGTNGSSKTTPAKDDILVVISTPEAEGTTEGEKFFHQSGTAFNYTQIFRKDVVLTGTAIAISTYGIENTIIRQTTLAMQEFLRDMGLTALRGIPVTPGPTVNGAAGGLLYFATQTGGLSVNANSKMLDSYLINDGNQAVAAEGGRSTAILCGIGQARVISADNNNRVVSLRQDTQTGRFVAEVINDVTGGMTNVFADPAFPDDQVIIADTTGFGLVPLKGRSVWDIDTTPKGFDGIRRTILGEYTFEFKNAKQRLCRIYGLKSSALSLATKRDPVKIVKLDNSAESPVFTKAVTE